MNPGLLPRAVAPAGALLLAAMTLLSAPAADAQLMSLPLLYNFCGTPTLYTCQTNSLYRQGGACWEQYKYTCRDLLRAEYSLQHDGLTITNSTTVPTGMTRAGQDVTSRTHAANYTGYYGGGLYSTFSGDVIRSDLRTLNPPGGWLITPRAAWELSGNQVNSCDEYVHERYYNFARYETDMQPYGKDHVTRFVLAYWASQPIAYANLVSRNGQSLGAFPWPSGVAPKNPYFQPLQLQMPDGSSSTLTWWDSQLTGGRNWAQWNWNTHWSVGIAAIGAYTVDELEDEYELALQYNDLVRERRRIYDEWYASWGWCHTYQSLGLSLPASCIATRDAAQNQLGPIDFGIAVSLYQAQQRGCLDTSKVTACDWSPKFFNDMLQQRMASVREPDHKRCVRLTQNTFSSGLMKQLKDVGMPEAGLPADSYNTDTTKLTNAFNALDAFISTIPMPIDPATKKPRLFASKSDNSAIGSEWFGAKFDYYAGWGLKDFAAPNRMCQAQFEARGVFNAKGTVLKKEFDVVNVLASVETSSPDPANLNRTDLRTQAYARFLNNDIFTPKDETTTLYFNVVVTAGHGFNLKLVDNIYIPVLGVPVKLAGGVAGKIGLTGTLTGKVERDCGPANTVGLGVGGELKPYGSLEAFAQASIDAFVIEVGIRGRVTLVSIELPLVVNANITTNGNELWFNANTGLNLRLRTLDGRVTVFAESWLKDYETDLVSFRGPEVNTNLFTLNYTPIRFSMVKARLDTAF